MIYLVGSYKGGSGKTTTATNLAVFLSEKNRKVLFIDGDEQKTASLFNEVRAEDDSSAGLDMHTLLGAKLRTGVAALAAKADDTVIDVGGRDSTTQRAALAIADVYLVPFAPRSPDLWTCNLVDELVKEAKGVNPKLQAYSFVSRADQYGLAGAAGQMATSILSSLEHLEFLPLAIGNRVAFEKAFSQGLSVLELQPADAKANAEVTALFTHIQTIANEKAWA